MHRRARAQWSTDRRQRIVSVFQGLIPGWGRKTTTWVPLHWLRTSVYVRVRLETDSCCGCPTCRRHCWTTPRIWRMLITRCECLDGRSASIPPLCMPDVSICKSKRIDFDAVRVRRSKIVTGMPVEVELHEVHQLQVCFFWPHRHTAGSCPLLLSNKAQG